MKKNYLIKPVFTPVRSSQNGNVPAINEDTPENTERAITAASSIVAAPAPDDSIRAENEDDDGYDPYSDRREELPLFERDPWG